MSAPKPRSFIIPAHERAIRAAAADPRASVVLKANAGSGKTTILTERVVRLMLDGADPARILCLTYTKAAAAEMQDRIFTLLATWVELDDAALSAAVAGLMGKTPALAAVARARALFARAVETPGGLKIQTIHAFAERLLHLFPFEANVPVRFAVMDDIARTELLDAVRRAVLAQALAQPQTPLGTAVMQLTQRLSESDLDGLLRAALPLLRGLTELPAPAELKRRLRAELKLSPTDSEAAVYADILNSGLKASLWPTAIAAVRPAAATDTDRRFVKVLDQGLRTADPAARVNLAFELLLTQAGKIRETRSILGVAHLRANPWLDAAITESKQTLPGFLDRLNGLATVERSAALMIVAGHCLMRFRAAKQAQALVDFDDMIDRTVRLMRDEGASWVLRKLDGGLDHVLIDEAQDTTPDMWRIARALTEEFFAGEGARTGLRTVFAVGDEKQSIFSFQGARPESFAAAARDFGNRVAGAGLDFVQQELKLSFRTVHDVLSAVDQVFSSEDRFAGLSSDHLPTVHETARGAEPGQVEIWPPEPPPEKEDHAAWEEVDSLGERSAPVRLATRIARHIAGLVQAGRFAHDGTRIRPGDIMILIQQRSGIFDAVIRALKREGVPVAGADRLKLSENLAVIDLVAAGRIALQPDDDLTLAAVLKSPLIGLTDDDLIALAPSRPGSLYAALGASENPAHHAAFVAIEQWRRLARREIPSDFFAALLGVLGGRKALTARLGPDVLDGVDMFLEGVRDRESRAPPSLLAEVEAFGRYDIDVKRDQDQSANAVRVLTVHGAKGLEAPIVYLADATRAANVSREGRLFRVGDADGAPLLLWGGVQAEQPRHVEALRLAAQGARRDEYRRLLYVAMTRARDRLIVAGWGKPDQVNPESWYGMMDAALGAAATEDEDGVRVWRSTTTKAAPPHDKPDDAVTAPEGLPAWALRPAAPDPVVAPPLRPSRALDAADRNLSPERAAARQRGDLVHALIERLPGVEPARRARVATAYLAAEAPGMALRERDALAVAVLGLLERAELQALFGPGSRAEVAISGEIDGGDGIPRPVLGRIDRLVIAPDRILIADFKTGARPPSGPRAGHLVQLALYRALLSKLYPDRGVQALLVWTRDVRVEAVAASALDAALTRAMAAART